jgi:hypothetical protein
MRRGVQEMRARAENQTCCIRAQGDRRSPLARIIHGTGTIHDTLPIERPWRSEGVHAEVSPLSTIDSRRFDLFAGFHRSRRSRSPLNGTTAWPSLRKGYASIAALP